MIFSRSHFSCTLVLVAALSAPTLATASVVQYSSDTTWLAAVPGNVQSTEFAAAVSSNATTSLIGLSSLTVGSVGSFGLTGFAAAVNTTNAANAAHPALSASAGGSLIAQGGNAVNAALFQLSSDTAGALVTITFSTGDAYTLQTGADPIWWGFTSTRDVAYFSVTSSGGSADILNFYTGAFTPADAASTPEFPTLLLVASGLAALVALQKMSA